LDLNPKQDAICNELDVIHVLDINEDKEVEAPPLEMPFVSSALLNFSMPLGTNLIDGNS
jgi:hypothetical protein